MGPCADRRRYTDAASHRSREPVHVPTLSFHPLPPLSPPNPPLHTVGIKASVGPRHHNQHQDLQPPSIQQPPKPRHVFSPTSSEPSPKGITLQYLRSLATSTPLDSPKAGHRRRRCMRQSALPPLSCHRDFRFADCGPLHPPTRHPSFASLQWESSPKTMCVSCSHSALSPSNSPISLSLSRQNRNQVRSSRPSQAYTLYNVPRAVLAPTTC